MPLHFQSADLEDQPIYRTINRFLHDIHKQEGRNVTHVTVTIHGHNPYFVPGPEIHRLEVTRMKGFTTLAYQEMSLEAPVENTVMVIAPCLISRSDCCSNQPFNILKRASGPFFCIYSEP